MTETVVDVPTGVRDFSHDSVVRFRIDRKGPNGEKTPEYFDGLSDLPALLLVEFAAMTDQLNDEDLAGQTKVFKDLFNLVLTDESAARFIDRMSDKTNPISVTQINDILPWIMEQYGMRPMTPSEVSSSGSENPDGGTNSTEIVPLAESTSEPSPATVSST